MHKDKIKKAALSLFQKISFVKTSVSDIAKVCGLGKGTIYLYFPSKDDILEALTDDRLNNLIKEHSPFYYDISIPLQDKLAKILTLWISEYFVLRDLLFGSFENIQHRILKDVFVKFGKYHIWLDRMLVTLIKMYKVLPDSITEEDLGARVHDYIDLITGSVIFYIVKSDWNNLDVLITSIQPLGQRLFRQFVLTK